MEGIEYLCGIKEAAMLPKSALSSSVAMVTGT